MKHSPPITFAIESNAGYTIIEILIAIAIFSIGLMAMSALQTSSLMATGEITRKTEAWSILDDQADTLRAMPFYANDNGLDDDADGATDELTEEMPDLVAGNYNVTTPDGRYTVYWQVVDDQPIPAVNVTLANPALPEVPIGNYTVSKTVSVQVTQARYPLTPANTLAEVQFVKTWAADGIP